VPIFSILAVNFSLSMFYRASSAVIAPNLVSDLGLTAESLGMLGGAFFYSFALLQIPMGILLDRIGPRIVITLFSLIGALGAFIFAGSHTLVTAFTGRALMGAGMACGLIGALKVIAVRFPPRHFSSLSGTMVSLGMVGSVLATSPLAYLTIIMGWRTAFIIAGVITAAVALLIFWTIEGKVKQTQAVPSPSGSPDERLSLSRVARLVLGTLSFWQIGGVAFFRYGTYGALQSLWLGPYLMDVKRLPAVQSGNIIMMLSIGLIAGAPVAGRLADRVLRSEKGTILLGVSLYALTFLPLTGIVTVENSTFYSGLFFLMGFFSGFGQIAYSHGKALFPAAISGTVIAGINFFVIAGAAVFMPLLGLVIEPFARYGGPDLAKGYHLAFLICFLGTAASLVFYAFSKTRK
jgi:MFS family permease